MQSLYFKEKGADSCPRGPQGSPVPAACSSPVALARNELLLGLRQTLQELVLNGVPTAVEPALSASQVSECETPTLGGINQAPAGQGCCPEADRASPSVRTAPPGAGQGREQVVEGVKCCELGGKDWISRSVCQVLLQGEGAERHAKAYETKATAA